MRNIGRKTAMNIEKKLYQWDTEQKLTGCTGLYVDFPIGNEVYRVETADGTCIIPDELLQTSGSHKVYECMTNNTIRSFAFSVTPRPKPPDYVYTPTERLTFEGLVQRVDDAVADMIRRAESGEFDGHTPVKGTDYFTTGEIQQIQNEVSSGAIGEFKSVVDTETETFNTNAESKLTTYNENDVAKTGAYNTNASNKVTEYNSNAENKTAEFDTHTEQIQADISGLKSDLSDLQDIPVGNLIDGGFVTSDGSIGINQYYSYTDFIKIYPAKKIKLNMCFESNNSVGIAFYTKPTDYKDFVSFVKNDGEIGNAQVVDVPSGAKYVRISHKNSVAQEQYLKLVDLLEIAVNADEALNIAKSLRSVDAIYRKVYEDVDLIKSIINGYVKDDGTFATNDSWRRTDYIDVSNLSKVYFKGIVYWQYYAFYREDKTFLGGKDQYGAWDYSNGICSIDVPIDAKYLIVSFSSVADAESGWGSASGTEPTGKVIYSSLEEYRDYSFSPTNPCDYTGDEICTFNKILCIGDSITQGVFNHNESGSVEYATIGKYSYPTYLGKLTNVEVVNWGIGGDTSVDWWNKKQNENFSGYDCCIINLGINDVLKQTSIEDSRTAFTNILNAVKSANKNIKVFFATIVPAYAKGDSTYDNINTLIKEFATNENCYLVDLTEYGHCVKGGAYENGHLTALGYHRLAHDYKAYISFIMNQNQESFKWVQFIGTDMKQN